MSSTEHESMPENLADASDEAAKPILEKIDSQITVMSSTEHESTPENLADASDEAAKPILEKIDSQITAIINGFNKVFEENGLEQVTIGDFQYIIGGRKWCPIIDENGDRRWVPC